MSAIQPWGNLWRMSVELGIFDKGGIDGVYSILCRFEEWMRLNGATYELDSTTHGKHKNFRKERKRHEHSVVKAGG